MEIEHLDRKLAPDDIIGNIDIIDNIIKHWTTPPGPNDQFNGIKFKKNLENSLQNGPVKPICSLNSSQKFYFQNINL